MRLVGPARLVFVHGMVILSSQAEIHTGRGPELHDASCSLEAMGSTKGTLTAHAAPYQAHGRRPWLNMTAL